MDEEKRMQLTEIVMNLIKKFSGVEMRDHLIAVYTWYQNIDKKNKKAMHDRAEEWASLIKERRTLITEHKKELLQVKHEEAERVDQARRSIYFFYEQFVTMWRVGEATQEVLKCIDFPGKGRIRDFLNFVAPLDQANYYIVIGTGKENKNKNYRPKIYSFMEMYLKMLDMQSMERKELEDQSAGTSAK